MKRLIIPTHLPYLDRALGGGQFACGVHGILGPTGGGKSHLATMIAVSGATGGSVFSSDANPQKTWVLFDLGSSGGQSTKRAILHAARSHEMDQYFSSDEFHRFKKHHPDDLPHDEHGNLLTPQIRIRIAKERLHKKLALFHGDFAYNAGDQSTPLTYRIAQILQEISGHVEIGGIVIDGVCDVWGFEFMTSKLSERQFILNFVSRFCRQLSDDYQCPVWVTHQISGKSCSALPIAPLSHYNSARCKSFAESLDACVVFGTKSDEGWFALQCTKNQASKAVLDSVVLEYDACTTSFIEVQGLRVDRNKQKRVRRANESPLLCNYEKDCLQQKLADLRAKGTASQRDRRV